MSNKTATATPILVLVAICVIAATLLGLVHNVTDPVIRDAEEAEARAIYESLFPQASTFEELPTSVEGCDGIQAAFDDAGNQIGMVIVASGRGYGGQVPVAVAFDSDGTVRSMVVMENEETPGLGSKATGGSYLDQYVGRAARPIGEKDVDLVSGATITSKAVLSAFNTAVTAYEEARS